MGTTYNKNGLRKHSIDLDKKIEKQIKNFNNIILNMEILDKEIENYEGLISKDNLNTICNAINLEKRLKLTEEQLKIVSRKYE